MYSVQPQLPGLNSGGSNYAHAKSKSKKSKRKRKNTKKKRSKKRSSSKKRAKKNKLAIQAEMESQFGTLMFFCSIPGATIFIDGKEVGTVPMTDPLSVNIGEHTVKATRRGFTDYFDTIEVPAGGVIEVNLELFPNAGILKIYSNIPDAGVFIDDKVIGAAPYDGEVPLGRHQLKIHKPGYKPYIEDVDVVVGQEIVREVELEADPNFGKSDALTDKWWFWTGIGAVVVTGAVLFFGSSEQKNASFDDERVLP